MHKENKITETKIKFNPNFELSTWSYVEGEGYDNRSLPAYLVLGHEMVHTIRRMSGKERDRTQTGYYLSGPQPKKPLMRIEKPEELETVGIDYVKINRDETGKLSTIEKVNASAFYYTENALRLENDLVYKGDPNYMQLGRRAAYK